MRKLASKSQHRPTKVWKRRRWTIAPLKMLCFHEQQRFLQTMKVVSKMHNPWNSDYLFNHKTQRVITATYRPKPSRREGRTPMQQLLGLPKKEDLFIEVPQLGSFTPLSLEFLLCPTLRIDTVPSLLLSGHLLTDILRRNTVAFLRTRPLALATQLSTSTAKLF